MIVYRANPGEPLDAIVENTATIDIVPSETNPYGADKTVQFPDGTVIRLEDVRTFWFLNRWTSDPAGTPRLEP